MQNLVNPKIDFSVSTLGFGKIRHDTKVWGIVRPHLNHLLLCVHYFDRAPFTSMELMFRYGMHTNLLLEFKEINKRYKDLPVTLELDMKILQWADEENFQQLQDIFMIASLEALIQVGQKYLLPLTSFLQERAQYPEIPHTIEECEEYTRVPRRWVH